MMNNFEAAAAYIIPSDSVARKCSSPTKRASAEISAVKTQPPKKKLKNGCGKTGVELAFHSKAEYQKLTSAQKAKLYE